METEKRPAHRPKKIQEPKLMWQYFEKYRYELKAKPIIEPDWVGRDAIEVKRPHQRPLTMEGFQNWLEDNEIITDVTDYFQNKGGTYGQFLQVCSRIKRTIRQDQIEGGMAGIYNPSITQRLNGLTDKTEVKLNVEQPLFNDIPGE